MKTFLVERARVDGPVVLRRVLRPLGPFYVMPRGDGRFREPLR